MTLHIRPFAGEYAVHHGIADAAVAARPVIANHAVLFCPQRFNGALRTEVEIVGPETDHLAAHLFEAVAQQQQFASGVDVGALATLGFANLPALIASLAALGLMGEVLTNPAAVRWLTSAPKRAATPAGMRSWLADLSRIAARDPALAPVYNELAAAQEPRSSRGAYADDSQRRGSRTR